MKTRLVLALATAAAATAAAAGAGPSTSLGGAQIEQLTGAEGQLDRTAAHLAKG